MHILVTWGSKRGGTEDIAQMLGDALRAEGLTVDVLPARDASCARGLGGVIVGGSLYMSRWHPDASRFVLQNEERLRTVPVWFFSSGPLDDSASRATISPTRQVRALMGRVGAQGHATFGGRLAPDARGFLASAIAKTHSGDWRSPEQIRAWAAEIARALPDAKPMGAAGLKPIPGAAIALSTVTIACAVMASTVTLVWSGVFPPPPPPAPANGLLAEARGYCAATMVLAVPLALASLRTAVRGSARGRLLWIGSLGYFVYTYLEFAVSPPLSVLYLVYIAAFACAIPALVLGVSSIDADAFAATFGARRPRRTVAAFALAVSVLLSVAWLQAIVSRTLAGNLGWLGGEDVVGSVVRALDLGLQVPLAIATGVLLLLRRPSGYLLAAMFLVMAVCMGGSLAAMVAWRSVVTGRTVLSATPFGVAWIVAVAIAIGYFRAPSIADRPRRPH